MNGVPIRKLMELKMISHLTFRQRLEMLLMAFATLRRKILGIWTGEEIQVRGCKEYKFVADTDRSCRENVRICL